LRSASDTTKPRAAFAHEACRDELADFDVVENRACDRSVNDGRVELGLRVCQFTIRLHHLAANGIDPLLTRADANQFEGAVERRDTGLAGVVARLGVIKILARHNALAVQRANPVEIHARILEVGLGLFKIGLGELHFLGTRTGQ
jgi:hypothetical protein